MDDEDEIKELETKLMKDDRCTDELNASKIRLYKAV